MQPTSEREHCTRENLIGTDRQTAHPFEIAVVETLEVRGEGVGDRGLCRESERLMARAADNRQSTPRLARPKKYRPSGVKYTNPLSIATQ